MPAKAGIQLDIDSLEGLSLDPGFRRGDESIFQRAVKPDYCYFRLTSVCNTWSWVLMLCALAWYTRCAVIIATSSAVRSTLESSRAADCNAPRLPVPGTPTIGNPDAVLSAH